MQIEILGGLRIKDDHGREITLDGRRPRRRPRQLVFALAYRPGALSAAQLQRLLWDGDTDKTSALTSLVHATRRWLPDGFLLTLTGEDVPDRYQVPRGPGHRVDVDEWRQAIKLADRARDTGDRNSAIRYYTEALALWDRADRTDPLPDVPDTPVMQDERELLLQQFRDASESYVGVRMDDGERSLALADRIRELMTRQPINSWLIAQHMLVLYQSGRKEAALAAYHDAVRAFDSAFDTTPGPELTRLYDQIVHDDTHVHRSRPAHRQRAVLTTGGPSIRGVHDAALGGKDNTQADRHLLDTIDRQAGGGYREALADGRRALADIVKRGRAAGIRQWLDLGSGMPAPWPHRQIHQIAAGPGPAPRVLYVDNDPIVAVHANALMADGRHVVFRQADLTDTDHVLYEARRLFDMREPVAVLAAGSLHHVGRATEDLGTAELADVLRTYMRELADGSVLAITHLTGDQLDPRLRPYLDATAPDAPLPHYLRTTAQIQNLFGDLPLTRPGLIPCSLRRSDRSADLPPVRILAGHAVKGATPAPPARATAPRTRPRRTRRAPTLHHPPAPLSADRSSDSPSSMVAP
ncbi:SAM-dependent methyltransferase [Actinomadura geliboluensis]|uniref:SAM-dependent methyltransferase n=1 Tax=Actinomadura geliboluensis TaxID=882440 RepID=UPI00371C622D